MMAYILAFLGITMTGSWILQGTGHPEVEIFVSQAKKSGNAAAMLVVGTKCAKPPHILLYGRVYVDTCGVAMSMRSKWSKLPGGGEVRFALESCGRVGGALYDSTGHIVTEVVTAKGASIYVDRVDGVWMRR